MLKILVFHQVLCLFSACQITDLKRRHRSQQKRIQTVLKTYKKNPLFFRIKNRGLSPRSKFFIHILLPKRGLEPLRIAPYAPETHVSTIPPLRHNLILPNYIQFSNFSYALSGGCWFKTNPLGKPDV